jgi:hypothetical protein
MTFLPDAEGSGGMGRGREHDGIPADGEAELLPPLPYTVKAGA